jgi:dihydrofolate reductase
LSAHFEFGALKAPLYGEQKMNKLVLAMFTSVDGMFAGPKGEFIGPQPSGDLQKHWSGYNLAHAKHLLYGRAVFMFNRAFWSAAESDPASPAAKMPQAATLNKLPKTVLSKTLTGDPGWNASIVSDDVKGAVARLKDSAEGDIYAFGGAGLARSLIADNLVDEYRLLVTPHLLGNGLPLFKTGFGQINLELIESRSLDTGAVILHYRRR